MFDMRAPTKKAAQARTAQNNGTYPIRYRAHPSWTRLLTKKFWPSARRIPSGPSNRVNNRRFEQKRRPFEIEQCVRSEMML
jgi:hypothetical protein